jgi:hypothetical protein
MQGLNMSYPLTTLAICLAVLATDSPVRASSGVTKLTLHAGDTARSTFMKPTRRIEIHFIIFAQVENDDDVGKDVDFIVTLDIQKPDGEWERRGGCGEFGVAKNVCGFDVPSDKGMYRMTLKNLSVDAWFFITQTSE